MNRCIKRKSGGVMRISDYWLLEVVQQCQWILKETDSSHTQNIRSKKIFDTSWKRKRFQRKINRRKEQRNTTIMSNQELNKIKNLIQQIKREKSSEKRQQMIVQVLELMTIIL